jgi:hypothetical protein
VLFADGDEECDSQLESISGGAAMNKVTAQWQDLHNNRGYVVEHGGMLKTGSFSSKERAVEWFARELDAELVIEGEYVERVEAEA